MQFQKNLWLTCSLAGMVVVLILSFLGIQPIKSSVYIGIGLLFITIIPIYFKKWAQYRRDFGIASGILLLIHGFLAFRHYFALSILRLFDTKILGGTVAAVILVAMLITSNFMVQRKIKGMWRVIHAFLWFALPLALVHAVMAVGSFFGEIPVFAVVTLGGLVLFVFIKPVLPGSSQKESLRDIGFALVGAVCGLILFFGASAAKTPTVLPVPAISPKAVTSVPTLRPAQGKQDTATQPDVPSPTVAPENTPSVSSAFTLADLARHNTESDCYVAFQGQIYDITAFLPMHPGGAKKAAPKCGQALDSFDSKHSGGSFTSDVIQSVLRPLSIGTLK